MDRLQSAVMLLREKEAITCFYLIDDERVSIGAKVDLDGTLVTAATSWPREESPDDPTDDIIGQFLDFSEEIRQERRTLHSPQP